MCFIVHSFRNVFVGEILIFVVHLNFIEADKQILFLHGNIVIFDVFHATSGHKPHAVVGLCGKSETESD